MIDIDCDTKCNHSQQNNSKINLQTDKFDSINDYNTPKHYYGASARRFMFTLSEDIVMIKNRNREENEVVCDLSFLSNNKLQKEIMKEKIKNENITNTAIDTTQQIINQIFQMDEIQIDCLKESILPEESIKCLGSSQKKANNFSNSSESKRCQGDFYQSQEIRKVLNDNKQLIQNINSSKVREQSWSKNISNTGTVNQSMEISLLMRIKISQITKKFIIKIKQLSQKYNFYQLTKRHYKIINDKASIYQDNRNSNEQQQANKQLIVRWIFKYQMILHDYISSIQTLNPESTFSIICDIIYGLVLLCYLFIVPIILSFSVKFHMFEKIVFLVFAVNSLLTLNKCYYYQGRLISDRKKIVANYLKNTFIIDAVILIFIYNQFIQFVVFLKFFEMNDIIKRTDNHFQIIRKMPITFCLINLAVKMVLIAQIAGCMFHYVAIYEIEQGENQNWLTQMQINENSWESKYIVSIYFAFITMMTVGYGDVTPVNNYERIYVIFMTILSSGIFGYVVNTIGQLYQQQEQKQKQFQKTKQDITLYLNERQIDTSTKLRVLNYLEYAFQFQKQKDQDPLILFQNIPQSLVEEVYINYYGRYLLQNKIMKLNFSETTLKALSICMKEKNLAPNEYLFHKGIKDTNVYFLVSGKIDIVYEGEHFQTLIETVSKQGIEIGLKSSFIDQEKQTSAKCQKDNSCTLVYFEMKDFKNILLKFSKDYERFCELRDDIIFNSNNLDTQCASCLRYDHNFSKCPLISLNISNQNCINKYNNIREPQTRVFQTRKLNKTHTLQDNSIIKIQLKQYRMSLVYLIAPEMRENEQIFYHKSDKFFYDSMPAVKVKQVGDIETDMEDHNIFEVYETLTNSNDENAKFEQEDEKDYYNNHKKQDLDHLNISRRNSMENNIVLSSHQQNNLQPEKLQFHLSNVRFQDYQYSQTLQIGNGNNSNQKTSQFSKKPTQNIENNVCNNNETSPKIHLNQNNNQTSKNKNFQRERGDLFIPLKQFSQQLSQRSLQSQIKSPSRQSEVQISNKPNNKQVCVQNGIQIDDQYQKQLPNYLFIYDFDRLKVFEKYFSKSNYTNILSKIHKIRVKNLSSLRRVLKKVVLSPQKHSKIL